MNISFEGAYSEREAYVVSVERRCWRSVRVRVREAVVEVSLFQAGDLEE